MASSTMARCPWSIGRLLAAQAFTSRSSPLFASFWIKFTSFWLSFTLAVLEGGVGADCARRWGLLPMPVSSLPSWARMVPITDRLPAIVAMIANREIDMNSGFIGLFLFRYYISLSGLWHVKLEIWTLARLFGSLFLTG